MAGIAISAPHKYYEYLIKNVHHLRSNIKYMDPIEIWEVGDELTSEMRESLSLFPNIILKNTTEFDDRIQHWRGYQSKAAVIKFSKLNDIIISDADVVIFQDPSIIQKDNLYIETGSYLFRDYPYWVFNLPPERLSDQTNMTAISKFTSHNYYDGRRSFIKSLLPNISPFFPQEWLHLYQDSYPNYPAAESLVESGLFYINREKNNDVINTFYDLNDNWKETYECVYGDKELLWLAFIKHNKKFTLHNHYPTSNNNKLLQIYNNNPFYIQKY